MCILITVVKKIPSLRRLQSTSLFKRKKISDPHAYLFSLSHDLCFLFEFCSMDDGGMI